MTDPESIAESIIEREAKTFALAHSPACGFEYRKEKRADLKLRLIAELKKAADHARQELFEALKPLAAHADYFESHFTDAELAGIDQEHHLVGHGITVADCFKARALIARAEGRES